MGAQTTQKVEWVGVDYNLRIHLGYSNKNNAGTANLNEGNNIY